MEQEQLQAQIERTRRNIRCAMRCLLILLAAWIIALTSQAQTKDGYISVSYNGYSGGSYSILITDLQGGCNSDVKVQLRNSTYYTKTGVFRIVAPFNSRDTILVTDLSICRWSGSNPAIIAVPVIDFTSTPVVFVGSPKLTPKVGGVLVEFDVKGETGITQYVVHVAGSDGKQVSINVPPAGAGHYAIFVKL